jgi:hypothetical protein
MAFFFLLWGEIEPACISTKILFNGAISRLFLSVLLCLFHSGLISRFFNMAVEKVTSDAPVVGEKGVVRDVDERAPVGKETFTATGEEYEQDDFMTRTGLNAKSFTRKHYGLGLVELDRKMKPRHLQMVAIGGSIGAGFFVGSGSALSKGVSDDEPFTEIQN